MVKTVGLGISIIILCSFSYWLGANNTPTHSPTVTSPAASDEDTSLLITKLNKLTAENSALHAQIALLHAQQGHEKKADVTSNTTPAEPIAAEQPSMDEQYRTLKRADQFASYVETLSVKGISLEKDMEDKFQAEAIDYDWAPDYQETLGELFTQDSSLREAMPETIECKTYRCQIKIRITDSDHANQITAAVSSALQTSALEKTDVIAAPNFSQGYLNLYIAKNNQSPIYEQH